MEIINNRSSLPVVIAKFNMVLPFQQSKIKLGKGFNLSAILNSIQKYNGKIILLLLKNKNIKNDSDVTYDDVYHVGTICKIQTSNINNNDFSELNLAGLHRVKIENLKFTKDYYVANNKVLKDQYLDTDEEKQKLREIIKLVSSNFSTTFSISPALLDPNIHISNQVVINFIYAISYTLSRDPEFIQKILEEDFVIKRFDLIISLLKNEIKLKKLDIDIDTKMQKSISSAQKEFYLREKLKAIKEELGELNSKSDGIDAIIEKLNSKKFPKNIENKIREELKKYEAIPQASAESGVIKTYIDWLLVLPWTEITKENTNLNKTIKILNKTHYSLKIPKERILEHLAVQIKTKNVGKGTIICFVGPPGVGKTSLAKSIAKATGRKFIKVSLGGVKDESEIRGHRRTYIGSMPGRIIQKMKKAQVINPLFLLDEIDKMSSDYKGDPSSAMLEVLDNEQNKYFSDHYIEEPYDLSKIMFIATANSINNIPSPLRDRLEIIELNSYTELEKYKIASQYLIPKVLLNTGLSNKNVIFPKLIIMRIIREYTMEAGVRQLERELDSICRKIVVKILKNKDENINVKVTNKILEQLLGIPKYNFTKRNEKSEVGVVTGLAWTQYGGDILPIEVTSFTGERKLHITGSLGDVMKESVNIALGYIKTNYHLFGINENEFQKDIHLHVPEGAIPKDGPSAGITITTALISLFANSAINKSIAMTGEITLRGNILAIGGLKEKLISATRSKIKTVFIPKDNIKDLQQIPKEVIRNLKIYPVENYMEVFNFIFKHTSVIENVSKFILDKYDVNTVASFYSD